MFIVQLALTLSASTIIIEDLHDFYERFAKKKECRMKRTSSLFLIGVNTLLASSLVAMYVTSCGAKKKKEVPTTGGSGASGSTSTTSCSLADNTTATTTTSSYACPLLTRDVSSCKASREAQGLSGFWLKFSCSVTLTKSGTNVVISTSSVPDYKSYYYSSTDICYEAFSSTTRAANPNKIGVQTISMTVPYAPVAASTATATPDGAIGIALNGVSIFDNTAAPGDDIYNEEKTFDKCDGHPEMTGKYHYHSEPSAISNTDTAFIGVLRDGFPIYGRNEYATSTTATGLDSQGGKTGTTVDSTSTSVYHYQTNLQTNGTASVYFLTKGYYTGTPGACTGCL
jgi:YHYH protein